MTASDIDVIIRKLIALRDALKVSENRDLMPDGTELAAKVKAEYAKISTDIQTALSVA